MWLGEVLGGAIPRSSEQPGELAIFEEAHAGGRDPAGSALVAERFRVGVDDRSARDRGSRRSGRAPSLTRSISRISTSRSSTTPLSRVASRSFSRGAIGPCVSSTMKSWKRSWSML